MHPSIHTCMHQSTLSASAWPIIYIVLKCACVYACVMCGNVCMLALSALPACTLPLYCSVCARTCACVCLFFFCLLCSPCLRAACPCTERPLRSTANSEGNRRCWRAQPGSRPTLCSPVCVCVCVRVCVCVCVRGCCVSDVYLCIHVFIFNSDCV